MKQLVIPPDVLKKSFYEIDVESRGNIYVYLWCSLCLELAAKLLILPIFIGFNETAFIYLVLIFFYILSIISLFILSLNLKINIILERIIEICIFLVYLQAIPFMCIITYIIFGLLGIFSGSDSGGLLSTLLSTSKFIITLWALRYILRLRRHAKNKVN